MSTWWAPPWTDRKARLWLAGLIVVAFGVFAFAELFWDDLVVIRPDGPIAKLSTIPRVFTERCVLFSHTAVHYNFYRPLVDLSFILEYAVAGQHSFPYHATNFLLHLANVFLAFRLFRQFRPRGLSTEAAFFGAAVFGFHPIQCESVLWPSARPGVLGLAFLQLALLVCLRMSAVNLSPSRRVLLLVGAWLCSLAALVTKECAVVLLLAVLIPLMARETQVPRHLWIAGGGLVALVFAFLLLNSASSSLVGNLGQESYWLAKGRLLSAAMGTYLVNLLWPFQLSPCYSLSWVENRGLVISGTVCLCLLVPVSLWLWWRRTVFSLFLLAGLVILVGNGLLPLWANMPFPADRYLYQGLWGAGLGCGIILDQLIKRGRWPSQPQIAVVLGVAILLAGLSLRQSAFWLKPVALWSRVMELDPNNPYAAFHLGDHFEKGGDLAQAVRMLEPTVYSGRPITLRVGYANAMKLGKLCFRLDHPDAALRAFRFAWDSPEFYPEARVGSAVVQHHQGNNASALAALAEFKNRQDLKPFVYHDLALLAWECQQDIPTARDYYSRGRASGLAPQPELEKNLGEADSQKPSPQK